jgi:hypothetical protein
MKIEIKSWYTGSVLFEGDFSSLVEAVLAAIKAKADLRSADLSYADLRYANLSYADLRYANLSYADLRSADLSYADLRSADLRSAKNADYAVAVTRILPDGDIIGWTKLKGGIIAKLLIPADAKRSHAFGRKCRAECAKVLELWDGKKAHKEVAQSGYEAGFSYEIGKTVKPSARFDDDFTNECSTGIHFFITRLEAEAYEL